MDNNRPVAGVRADEVLSTDRYYNRKRPEILSRLPKYPKRILDVGCGSGALGATIKEHYPEARVVGIEYCLDSANLAKQRLDQVYIIDLNHINEDSIDGQYDVIILGDVIEHLLHPEQALSILRRKITDDGVIILSVPNVRHWSVLLPLLVEDRFTYKDKGLLDRTHVHLFTLKEIRAMLKKTGWSVENVVVRSSKMPKTISDKLLKLVHSFGGNRSYSKITMEAFQYIIDAKPVN